MIYVTQFNYYYINNTKMSYICKILSPRRRKKIDPSRVMFFTNIEQCLLNIENNGKQSNSYSYLFSAKVLHNRINYISRYEEEKYSMWFDYLNFLTTNINKEEYRKKSKKFRKKVLNKVKKKDIFYR